jgi:Ca-activated chloride channel family protein
MFRFASTIWLAALALVPFAGALFVLASRRRRKALEAFAEQALVRKLTDSVSAIARRWKAALMLGALALLAVALARPQFGSRVETVRSVGQDIVVAVDLSTSMLAEDASPNRLERARLAILRLIGNLDGDRIALVAFAGTAFVQSPLTVDYSAAAMFLDAMHPDLMPVQGTDLGAALRVSLDALGQGARDARVIVLVTDGEHLEGDFEAELERAVESGVAVHVVGIGSPEGGPIPQYDQRGERVGFLRDDEGAVVTTRLDEATLSSVAERTGARYVRAGAGGAAFDDLVDEIASVEGEAVEARQVTLFEEQFQIFLGIALAMLWIEWLIPDRRRRRVAWAGRFEVLLLVALFALPAGANAQEGRTAVRDGNRLYEEGRFQEAHERYLQGLAETPGSGVLRFNDGNALYRSDEYAQAMEAYERAIETGDPALASSAWYNLGNALYRQQQLEQSLEAYKQALRLDPTDVDAKHNLERVLAQMQQQEQNQDQQNQDQQSQDQQNQDQQNQDQQQQDQNDQQQQQQSQQPDQQPPQQGPQQRPQPQPGQMTPEEAQRLLEAVDEDPDEVNRPRAPVTGVRPRRPW